MFHDLDYLHSVKTKFKLSYCTRQCMFCYVMNKILNFVLLIIIIDNDIVKNINEVLVRDISILNIFILIIIHVFQ